MLPTANPLESIGKQLMAARVERGLAVEDIAFKTHIPVSRVRELENDDFSNFANLTYAKGFLKIYSNYLDLDLSEYLEQFNTSEFANISGHDYIQSANTGLTSMSMAMAPDNRSGRGSALFGIILIAITAIGLPIWYWTRPAKEPVAAPVEPIINGPAPKPRIIEEPTPEPPRPPAGAVDPNTSGETPSGSKVSGDGSAGTVTPANPSPAGTEPKREQVIRAAIPIAKVIPEDPDPPAPALPPPAAAPGQ